MNEINNKVLAIVDLAMKISQNSKADIFVIYFGHTSRLNVSGHSQGWEKNHEADICIENEDYRMIDLPLNKDSALFDEDKINEVLAELESIWEGICDGQAQSESQSPAA